ncbi:MAG: hypothetical protein HOM77_06180 [Planctomycetes bacterium]|nr:hypothetical protein [Planctomycetota bacterium]
MLTTILLATLLNPQTQEGLIVFSPTSTTDAHLLDNDGTILHTWSTAYMPGQACYLLPDGDLMRTIDLGASIIGGAGGGVQRLAWDGTVEWEYIYSDSFHLQHHDIEVLPNGNVLMIAWDYITRANAANAGRSGAYMSGTYFAPDTVIEVDPSTNTIVWQWKAMDHVVQDLFPSRANYGVVGDHAELLDLNYPATVPMQGDWLHINGIDYNPSLDQIMLSLHNSNEIIVIDHSTTMAEAATHTGGLSGRGGDLLYRWGNPAAYDHGTTADQMLFGQHDAQWIVDGSPGAGNILVFNNGNGRGYSSVDELEAPIDPLTHEYAYSTGAAYGPPSLLWTYSDPGTFYSSFISGAQRQPNGNTLICEGDDGRLFEVDPGGTLVWDYFNPYGSAGHNEDFKVQRYQHFLWTGEHEFQASTGSRVPLHLQAGRAHAGSNYLLLATTSGLYPGYGLPGGLTLPLNVDWLTTYIYNNPTDPHFIDFTGTLDANGAAMAILDTQGALGTSWVGRTLDFAFITMSPVDFASTAISVEIK